MSTAPIDCITFTQLLNEYEDAVANMRSALTGGYVSENIRIEYNKKKKALERYIQSLRNQCP